MTRPDLSQHELGLRPPMQVIDFELISRQPSMSKALALCQSLSGKDDKHFLGAGGVIKDQAQWSRVMGTSSHNFPHDKFNLFMDLAGNEAPLLWLIYSRGYDLHSLRQRETGTEKKLRLAEERAANAEMRLRVLTEAFHGRVSA